MRGKQSIAVAVLFALPAVSVASCREGFVPSDTPGVCVESAGTVTNPAWIVNEKLPEDRMPSWQRPGIKLIDCPSTAFSDAQADREKAEAEAQGKRTAGLK